MKRRMFLTFWLRTENTYYNVKSNLTETAVFKREIKTDFIQGKDELISGKFSKISRSIYKRLFFKVLQVFYWIIRKLHRANRYGWFKAQNYQRHGVICETSITQQPSAQSCKIDRKVFELLLQYKKSLLSFGIPSAIPFGILVSMKWIHSLTSQIF